MEVTNNYETRQRRAQSNKDEKIQDRLTAKWECSEVGTEMENKNLRKKIDKRNSMTDEILEKLKKQEWQNCKNGSCTGREKKGGYVKVARL